MEEKKLTDEEIVKELEHCLNGDYKTKCNGCHYDKSKGYCQDMDRDALDLIKRLQSENEILQKENERLKKFELYRIKKTKEQEVEIERLTKDKSFATRKMMESKAKAVELQKKVDELKEENNRYAEVFGMVGKDFYTVEVGEWEKVKSGVKDMIQQSVKNTAKKIFQGLESMANNGVYQGKLTVQQMRVFFKEQYGVEVEE